MTTRMQMLMMFGLPSLIMVLFGVGIGVAEGDWGFLPFIMGVCLFSVLLVLGLTWGLVGSQMSDKVKVLGEIARQQGGEVKKNLLGEVQLRIPDQDGFITLDYRFYGRTTPGGRKTTHWTRLSWEGASPPEPALDVSNSLDKMAGEPSYSQELRTVLGQFLALGYEMGRVATAPSTSPPMVMFEIPTWVADPQQLDKLLGDGRGPLRNLAHIRHITR